MEDIKNYESMTEHERWNALAAVANLYYNSDLTQNQIAERMFTSRSKISRLLKEARELGIVEIFIREPWERRQELEKQLKENYRLRHVRVIAMNELSDDAGLGKLAEAAAYYLDSRVKEGMIVGISWGNTLYRIVRYISTNNRKNIPITVVPIMGAANVKRLETEALDLAKELSAAYGGRRRYLYAPLFVKDRRLRESLMAEENIRSVLDLSRQADMILTSVGSIVYKSWSNYLSEQTWEMLEDKGAVGHLGGHFFDINGRELETSLAERMIGLTLDEIKKCRDVICVAYGEGKSDALIGAMNGGIINTLIVDEKCARRILKV